MFERRFVCLLCALAVCAFGPARAGQGTAPAPSFSTLEQAYRANNRGVALLEQFKARQAVAEFQRALALVPRLPLAQLNLAIAQYNVPDLVAARRAAEAAQQLAPAAPQAPYIIGLVARAENRTPDALAAFQRVRQLDPRDAAAHINAGQLYAQQRNYTEAVAAFRAALAVEPYNVTALYNLGTTLIRTGQRAEGQQLLQRSQALRQSGAGTTLGQNYLEQGRYAEALVSTGAEADLVDTTTPAVTFTDATARVLPALPRWLVSRPPLAPAPLFNRQLAGGPERDYALRQFLAQFSTGLTLFDFDGDGDLDLFELLPVGQRLLRNDGGRFFDVTARSGALTFAMPGVGFGAAAGDYDNDGRTDLFVLHAAGCSLFHNDGRGRFTDATRAARLTPYEHIAIAAAFVDVDHDGDLDLFVSGFADLNQLTTGAAGAEQLRFPRDLPGAPNILWRNNGNGTFTDITMQAKVAGTRAHAVAVVPTDYDNRHDVDLLVVNYGTRPALYRNLRDGTFADVATEVGLDRAAAYTSVAAADVNKDGFTDFYFGTADDAPALMAISDGHARFRLQPAPSPSVNPTTTQPINDSSSSSIEHDAAQFFDYDNDGLLDLVCVATRPAGASLNLWRNVGRGWTDVSARALPRGVRRDDGAALWPRVLAAGDVDQDGDTDLFVRSASGNLKFLRNDGRTRNRSLRVRLNGRVSNRSGVAAQVELRAGSLHQRTETYAATPAPAPADIVFGLGQRAAPDALRVLWPSGTVQAETEVATSAPHVSRRVSPSTRAAAPVAVVTVTELDRKPSSCPFLYTWNGARFEFVTDFMGGGEMGDWLAPGVFNTPDPDEYVRITDEQLKPRNGRYELRVTNELEEALFVDRLQLLAVAHPRGVEVYPDEGLRAAPRPFKLYDVRDVRAPIAARDEHGHDVLARITRLDRRWPDDFALHSIRGYAAPHELTLDLGLTEKQARARVLLLLTGWTDYAYSSDNVAATQQDLSMQAPALQMRDAHGRWQTIVDDLGIPVGRPQTLVVDLTGKFSSSNSEVRIVTNMRVYWDRIAISSASDTAPLQPTRLDPVSADLHWRGYSQVVTPDGREPYSYDYARVSQATPWKVFPGRYTREGDVRELLTSVDDMFVVARTGDELRLAFDAARLPALPAGWTRTFMLYADGFSKEMNPRSASPDVLAPLPFHGMTRYPYDATAAYPATPARQTYIERYNTRLVTRTLAQLLPDDE